MAGSLEMQTISMLDRGLDGSMLRQKTVSNNLTNVNTPGYRRKEVRFERQLERVYLERGEDLDLYQAHEKHISTSGPSDVQPTVYRVDDTVMRNDGNNVDPDRSMATLAKNRLYYTGLSQMTRSGFQMIQRLIQDLR